MRKSSTRAGIGAVLACSTLLMASSLVRAADSTPVPNAPPPGMHHGDRLAPEDRQKLDEARKKALEADPALAAEGKDLMEKMKAHQQKLDQAMIAADPSVKPIIEKIQASHHHPGGPEGTPPPPPPGN